MAAKIPTRLTYSLLGAAAFGALFAASVPAYAYDHGHDDHRFYGHHYYHRGWGPPPVVYGAPYPYYAPPPVVYNPGFGIALPGVNINIR